MGKIMQTSKDKGMWTSWGKGKGMHIGMGMGMGDGRVKMRNDGWREKQMWLVAVGVSYESSLACGSRVMITEDIASGCL